MLISPHFKSLVALVLAAAFLPAPVTISGAAEKSSSGAKDSAPGRFTLAPAVMVTDLGIDTNVLAALNPKADITATPRVQIDPSGQLGSLAVRGTGGLGLSYYHQYSALRFVDADGSVRLDYRVNRITLHGGGSAMRTRDSFEPEIYVPVRRRETALEGGGELRVGGKTWIAAGVSRSTIVFNTSEVLFESSLRNALDRTIDTAMLSARTAITPLTTLVGRVDLQYDRFAHSPLRDANGTGAIAGLDFRPSAMIAGQAHVGYRRFISRDRSQPDVEGLVASIDLAYTLLDAVRFRLSVERDLGHSYSLTERYYISTDMRVSVTRRLNRWWDVTAMAGRSLLDYRGSTTSTGARDPFDRLFRYGGALEYRMGNATTLGVTGEYYQRDSELTRRKFDRLRLVSSLVYRF